MGRKKKEFNTEEYREILKKDKSGHYVPNAILLAELIKCKENDELSEDAALMFTAIATKLSMRLKYTNPSDREDCISSAVLDCVLYWRNFDVEKTDNAFAYITSICSNGFAKGWRKLGKKDLPDSNRLPLSDSVYSI